ncbi:MAG: hypothetical protein KAS32_02705 [Candidatus Peribacteraceae bacterium]|nr:hypothetical protein [Candidatus Peribacteraceae bacterium]
MKTLVKEQIKLYLELNCDKTDCEETKYQSTIIDTTTSLEIKEKLKQILYKEAASYGWKLTDTETLLA